MHCQENGAARHLSRSEPITFESARFSHEDGKRGSAQLKYLAQLSAFSLSSIPPNQSCISLLESPLTKVLLYVCYKNRQWFQIYSRSREYDDPMSRQEQPGICGIARSDFAACRMLIYAYSQHTCTCSNPMRVCVPKVRQSPRSRDSFKD